MDSNLIDKPVQTLPESVRRLMKAKPEVLAERFRKAYNMATKFAARSMDHYIQAGELLAALRERVAHGDWGVTLEALSLSPSRADRLVLLGKHSDLARKALEQQADLTLEGMEGMVRAVHKLEHQTGDLDEVYAIAKAAVEHKKRAPPKRDHLMRDLKKAFEALEAHAHDDPLSADVAGAMTYVKRKMLAIDAVLGAEDLQPSSN